jgi:hypothetical protein
VVIVPERRGRRDIDDSSPSRRARFLDPAHAPANTHGERAQQSLQKGRFLVPVSKAARVTGLSRVRISPLRSTKRFSVTGARLAHARDTFVFRRQRIGEWRRRCPGNPEQERQGCSPGPSVPVRAYGNTNRLPRQKGGRASPGRAVDRCLGDAHWRTWAWIRRRRAAQARRDGRACRNKRGAPAWTAWRPVVVRTPPAQEGARRRRGPAPRPGRRKGPFRARSPGRRGVPGPRSRTPGRAAARPPRS